MGNRYKYVLMDENKVILDSAEFRFDYVNYNSPLQQAGDYLVPEDEREDYYASDMLDTYRTKNGMRYIMGGNWYE